MVTGLEAADNANDEGFMGLIDFNTMILPRDAYLRAQATQRPCLPAENISNPVETQLARLI